jgi:hypothetical protein
VRARLAAPLDPAPTPATAAGWGLGDLLATEPDEFDLDVRLGELHAGGWEAHLPTAREVPGETCDTHAATCPNTCPNTCRATCQGTCPNTCRATCPNTCHATCQATCQATCHNTCGHTCNDLLSCGGTCAGTHCFTCQSNCHEP